MLFPFSDDTDYISRTFCSAGIPLFLWYTHLAVLYTLHEIFLFVISKCKLFSVGKNHNTDNVACSAISPTFLQIIPWPFLYFQINLKCYSTRAPAWRKMALLRMPVLEKVWTPHTLQGDHREILKHSELHMRLLEQQSLSKHLYLNLVLTNEKARLDVFPGCTSCSIYILSKNTVRIWHKVFIESKTSLKRQFQIAETVVETYMP